MNIPKAAQYQTKIAECLDLLDASDDPLARDVYEAMLQEFVDKFAADTKSRRHADIKTSPQRRLPLATHQRRPASKRYTELRARVRRI